MSKEEGQGLTFFFFYELEASLSTLFLSHSFLCLSHFLLMLFLRCFFLLSLSKFVFSPTVQTLVWRVLLSSLLPERREYMSFLRFLCSDLFFSPTEKALVWCVLLLWCLPERIPCAVIYTPQVCRSYETIFGALFLCFLGIETFRGNLWRVKFLLFQPRTTLVFSTLFRLCGRTTLPTPF